MHDELSAAEARLRGVRTRDKNARGVNDHGGGLLSWKVRETKKI